MEKKLSTYYLVVITIFVGALLSFSVFYVTNILIGGDYGISAKCYDGSVIEGENPISSFDRAVYQNQASLSFIREYQYRLFGVVDSTTVVAGENGFLFAVEDTENNYNYLEDFTGNCSFTEEELETILGELERRRNSYTERNAEYILVIIPNAQTVYSECMPATFGSLSESTRLEELENYLLKHEFYHFINLTDELRAHKSDGLLYNNTENSLNALGLYYTYQVIYQRFSGAVMDSTDMIKREELEFYQHMTTGKSLARAAGLADVVQNQTVSLSNSTMINYRTITNIGSAATTILLPFYISSETTGSPELLLQFSNTWERLQIEPYFSSTFGKVTYQTDLSDDAAIFEMATPKVVIQFLYENELSQLLP